MRLYSVGDNTFVDGSLREPQIGDSQETANKHSLRDAIQSHSSREYGENEISVHFVYQVDCLIMKRHILLHSIFITETEK